MAKGYNHDLMEARTGERCEICGIRTATEWHHCLFHRMEGKPELNHIYNLQHLCHECHEKHGNSRDNKANFYWKQFMAHDDFLEWYEKLPLKIKEQF